MLDVAGVTSTAPAVLRALPGPEDRQPLPAGATTGVAARHPSDRDLRRARQGRLPHVGPADRHLDRRHGPVHGHLRRRQAASDHHPDGAAPHEPHLPVALGTAIKAVTAGTSLPSTSWTFKTTTDGIAPSIIGRLPAVNATGVARTGSIAVRFSEGVKGVTGSTVQLRDTVTGLYVPATVSYDATAKRASLRPTASLVAHRKYIAIVRSSIRDLAGNPMTTASWSFTTGW